MPWKKLIFIYIAGVVVNCAYVALLCHVRNFDIQIPAGAYEHNVWERSDVGTYLAPAKTFLAHGSFLGRGQQPDYSRTVGYPFFLALNMRIFGGGWIPAVYYVQAILLAMAYPSFYLLALTLFSGVAYLPRAMLIYAFLSGTAMVYSVQVLSDGLCFSFLIAGLSVSLYGFSRNSWSWTIAGICLIGVAAQVRPVVGSIPFVLLCLGFIVLKSSGNLLKRSAVAKIVVCVCITFVIGLLPSVRNYSNYRMFRPTDLFSKAMLYMIEDIHRFNREMSKMETARADFDEIEINAGIGARVKAEDKYALGVIKLHPFLSAGFMVFNSLRNMFESHWQYTFFMFRSTWWQDDGYCVFKRTPLAVGFAVPWVIFYVVIYFAVLCFLIRSIKEGEWLIVAAALFVLLPIGAASFCGQGARLRLPAEWFLMLAGFAEIIRWLDQYRRPAGAGAK